MRDPLRDQESAEKFVDQTDADLIALAKRLNRSLIDGALTLSQIYDPALAARLRATATTLKAIRYELVRRRVPNPSGAQVVVNATGAVGKQLNTTVDQTIGTVTGGTVRGQEIGKVGGE